MNKGLVRQPLTKFEILQISTSPSISKTCTLRLKKKKLPDNFFSENCKLFHFESSSKRKIGKLNQNRQIQLNRYSSSSLYKQQKCETADSSRKGISTARNGKQNQDLLTGLIESARDIRKIRKHSLQLKSIKNKDQQQIMLPPISHRLGRSKQH